MKNRKQRVTLIQSEKRTPMQVRRRFWLFCLKTGFSISENDVLPAWEFNFNRWNKSHASKTSFLETENLLLSEKVSFTCMGILFWKFKNKKIIPMQVIISLPWEEWNYFAPTGHPKAISGAPKSKSEFTLELTRRSLWQHLGLGRHISPKMNSHASKTIILRNLS